MRGFYFPSHAPLHDVTAISFVTYVKLSELIERSRLFRKGKHKGRLRFYELKLGLIEEFKLTH